MVQMQEVVLVHALASVDNCLWQLQAATARSNSRIAPPHPSSHAAALRTGTKQVSRETLGASSNWCQCEG